LTAAWCSWSYWLWCEWWLCALTALCALMVELRFDMLLRMGLLQ
jgi:hypothetical protein